MEQLFAMTLEVEAGVDEDKVRHWLEETLTDKVEYHYFLANHAGVFSGWGTIDGVLFVQNSVAISSEEMIVCLSDTSTTIKSIKVTKKV